MIRCMKLNRPIISEGSESVDGFHLLLFFLFDLVISTLIYINRWIIIILLAHFTLIINSEQLPSNLIVVLIYSIKKISIFHQPFNQNIYTTMMFCCELEHSWKWQTNRVYISNIKIAAAIQSNINYIYYLRNVLIKREMTKALHFFKRPQ